MKKCISLLFLAGICPAAEIEVPGDFPTLAAALENCEPGDAILLAPGTYPGPVLIPENVSVRSAGPDTREKEGLTRALKTVIDAGGVAPAVVMREGALLDGLTVTGAGKFDEKEFEKHWETSGENLADERGAVGTGTERPAVEIDGVSATVKNCIVRDNGFAGIGVSGAGNFSSILGNRVFQNLGGGIGIANEAAPRIARNECFRNLRGGIGCRGAYPLIEENKCYRNVRAGIGIREGATPIVRNNLCYENRRAGIGIRMEGTSPYVLGNQCLRNGMAGIGCRDGASPVIRGNEVTGNRLAGIGARNDSHPVIVDNLIRGNEAAAIGLDACTGGTALIHGNTIEAKSLVGIGIQSGWTVTVEKNRIGREGGMPPLVMVFEGARADFGANSFEGGGVAAIRNAGRVFLRGNRFEREAPRGKGPARAALWNLEGASASMTDDNEFAGWARPELPAHRVRSDAELRASLEKAKPGDTILIEPGSYRGGIRLDSPGGEKGLPITLSGADPSNPPVFSGGNSGLHIVRAKHLELRHAVFTGARGNGLNVDDGGDPDSPSRFLTLSHLHISDVGSDGNQDGIKLSGVRDFQVRSCRIERWGKTGSGIDQVGCARGVISDSFFESRSIPSGSGIQAKGGSHDLRFLRTRFVNAGARAVNLGGSTGLPYFRPLEAPFEAANLIVTDCHFSGSPSPIAFVGVEGGVVRHCTLENPERWLIRILQETTGDRFVPCRNGVLEKNLFQYQPARISTAVNVGSGTDPGSFLFRGNTWKEESDPIAKARSSGPLPASESDPGFSALSPVSEWTGVRWMTPENH